MNSMTGIVLRSGLPHLKRNLPVPLPRAGEVLVRISHTTVNGHEIKVAASGAWRVVAKLFGARGQVQTGLEFAGIVRSEGVRYRVGDAVLGYVDMTKGYKPHAEFIAIPEAYLAHRPTALAPVQAAALPMSGQTALMALREIADVQAGDSVLILGAAGGVGVMAVQIARLLGAEVTAVANKRHHELLRKLGANAVLDAEGLDLQALNIEHGVGRHKLVFDLTTSYRYKEVQHLLEPHGCFIPANPLSSLFDVLFRRQVRYLWVDKGDAKLLAELASWAAAGKLTTVIDEVHEMGEAPAAFSRALARGKAGRVVMALGC